MYLPHSHKYDAGYLAYHRPEFQAYFDDHYVQLPLAKGDAAFFNPAVFHGAGTNRSADIRRMANLLADLVGLRPGDGVRSTGPASALRCSPP